MAPFIVNHPTLLNNWILAREKSLKKIREIKTIALKDKEIFLHKKVPIFLLEYHFLLLINNERN